MNRPTDRDRARPDAAVVLGVEVNVCSNESVTATVAQWAAAGESRSICFANAHVVTDAWRDDAFRDVLNGSDLVAPDGWPVAWALRRLGKHQPERVDGPNWMLHWCGYAQENDESIYLYGSTPETLERLESKLQTQFPALKIAGAFSPPFRPLTPDEQTDIAAKITESGASVVFVGLGAPRQEQWMAAMRGSIPLVMAGVGAAFDFHAGLQPRAPAWMQRRGLEWLYRLVSEPRRLWRRYLIGNTLFIVGLGLQLTGRGRR